MGARFGHQSKSNALLRALSLGFVEILLIDAHQSEERKIIIGDPAE